ncbi:MAG: shikimate dehydrogenase [Proteobacteria bacterium]|nr:shikimate dehydrogenase [Pseudomonadota bacterium]
MAERRALLGLIGAKIGRSITPAMQEAAGRSIGVDVRYHLIDADIGGFGIAELPRLLDGVRLLGFTGVNVTHPFKEAVVPQLDAVEGAAPIVGSVNTVVVRGRRLVGHNTDHSGFLAAWRRVFRSRAPGRVALIGAGGVGRAIAYGLLALGADELNIVDIDASRATTLARTLADAYPRARVVVVSDADAALARADGLVNATPIGSYAYPGIAVPEHRLETLAWVAEVIYTPLETRLIAAARRWGVAVLTGQELAIGQAVDAFALFFGVEAPADAMRAAFERQASLREADAAVTV